MGKDVPACTPVFSLRDRMAGLFWSLLGGIITYFFPFIWERFSEPLAALISRVFL